MKAAGRSLLLSELIGEIPWGVNLPIHIQYPDTETSAVLSVDVYADQIVLHVDVDTGTEYYTNLLTDVITYLHAVEDSRASSAIKRAATKLLERIEE